MRRLIPGMAFLGLCGSLAAGTLTLERTIPLPQVEGRIDHFSLDPAGARLFVAALGNNTIEVVDLKEGRVVRSLSGFAEPQGVLFLPELNRLFVAGGGDGTLRILNGSTCFFTGDILYLAVPRRGNQPAEIHCYRVES